MAGRVLLRRLMFPSCSAVTCTRLMAHASRTCPPQTARSADNAAKPLFWLLLAAGGSMAVHAWAGRDRASLCEAEQVPLQATSSSRDQAQTLERLKQWLNDNGMNIDLVEVKQSQAGPGSGLGMFVSESVAQKHLGRVTLAVPRRRWWWPFSGGNSVPDRQQPLATLPLSAAITAGNILQDPSLGSGYAWMLTHGVVDERTVIMAYLVIERLKGQASRISPWIDALPNSFDTPVMFSQEVLDELRGTPLHRAQAMVKARLKDQWSRMQPAINSLLEGQAGVMRQATFDDLLWAYSVFWSRGQSLPIPTTSGSADPHADAHALLEVQEGIIPGLDFCNHHTSAPNCWWEVVVPRSAAEPGNESVQPGASTSKVDSEGGMPPAIVQLRLHAGARVKPGEELLISYGDKSNEELLMLYGFAVPGNPNDHIMLHCPIPPAATWDDVMHMRMGLIKALGYSLQFFLPSLSTSATAGKLSQLPQNMLNTLEVFSMTPQEVEAALQAAKEFSGDEPTMEVDLAYLRQRRDSMSKEELKVTHHRLGLRLGACATLVKLLEARIEEQEGEQGTGMLEEDLEQLKAMEDTVLETPALRQRHACIVYRCEQKRIAQEYLRLARTELQDVMSLMQELADGVKAVNTSNLLHK